MVQLHLEEHVDVLAVWHRGVEVDRDALPISYDEVQDKHGGEDERRVDVLFDLHFAVEFSMSFNTLAARQSLQSLSLSPLAVSLSPLLLSDVSRLPCLDGH